MCIDMKWMSRQARCNGCEVLKLAVPLKATSVSITETVSSDTRAKSRTERARWLRRIILRRVGHAHGATQQEIGGIKIGGGAGHAHLHRGFFGDR